MNLAPVLISIVLSGFPSCVQSVHHPEVSQTSFCYDNDTCGPHTWGGMCNIGKRQSPIDITLPSGAIELRWTDFKMNDHYLIERKHNFYAQNNGHTALQSDLKICGGELCSCYNFAQLHFHWDETDVDGSEHTINGLRFPMEGHIVHYKEKYSTLADALRSNDSDAVAVMAVFFEIDEVDNLHLSSIVSALSDLREPGKVERFNFPIRVASLYPNERSFARYYGSLTTPTCDEKVVWTVFLTPILISENQMKQFRRLRNEEGISDYNFRPLQARNKRRVKLYQAGTFEIISTESSPRST